MPQDNTGNTATGFDARTNGIGREKDARIAHVKEAIHAGNLANVQRNVWDLVRDFPQDYDCLHLAGVYALNRHDLSEAHGFLSRALNLAPDTLHTASTLAALSEVLLDEGNPQLAEQYAKQALSLHGRNLDYYKLLARCYLTQGRVDEATAFLRSSLGSVPPPVQSVLMLQIADILTRAGRAQDALPIIDTVEMRNPDNLDILVRKATALEVLGNLEEARDYCSRALIIKPALPLYYALAKIKPIKREDPYINSFEQRLANTPDSEVNLRINLSFALAKAYDDLDEVDTAFGHLARGNKLKRLSLQYSEADEVESFERITTFFNAELMSRLAKRIPTSGHITPIFIVGMPRSGTTLVEQILSGHSQIRAAGELNFIYLLTKDLSRAWDSRTKSMPSDAELISDFTNAANKYRALISQHGHGVRFVTDKMPLNLRYLGFIRILFPDAIFIHCQRNPVDTCFSCYQQLFESNNLPFTYDLQELGGHYRLYQRYMVHWGKVMQPSDWINVKYESLVTGIEPQVRNLLEHCGLPFELDCLEFSKSVRTVLTASAAQVRQPLYTSAVGKWRRYEKHLGPLLDALGDLTSER